MSFLRRLLGRQEGEAADASSSVTESAPGDIAADEQARERELMRADAERLSDELIQRQMRYADRSWTPPAQGGTRRADDEEADSRG